MNTILETLNRRYATKAYDATKKVSNEDLHTILESIEWYYRVYLSSKNTKEKSEYYNYYSKCVQEFVMLCVILKTLCFHNNR